MEQLDSIMLVNLLNKLLEGGAQEIRKEAVRSIQQDPKSQVLYIKGIILERRHQSSAKGESPASDTGFLVSQIKVRKKNPSDEVACRKHSTILSFFRIWNKNYG